VGCGVVAGVSFDLDDPSRHLAARRADEQDLSEKVTRDLDGVS
jgi:hypothetical protein